MSGRQGCGLAIVFVVRRVSGVIAVAFGLWICDRSRRSKTGADLEPEATIAGRDTEVGTGPAMRALAGRTSRTGAMAFEPGATRIVCRTGTWFVEEPPMDLPLTVFAATESEAGVTRRVRCR